MLLRTRLPARHVATARCRPWLAQRAGEDNVPDLQSYARIASTLYVRLLDKLCVKRQSNAHAAVRTEASSFFNTELICTDVGLPQVYQSGSFPLHFPCAKCTEAG